jgi:hypothetical protein
MKSCVVTIRGDAAATGPSVNSMREEGPGRSDPSIRCLHPWTEDFRET